MRCKFSDYTCASPLHERVLPWEWFDAKIISLAVRVFALWVLIIFLCNVKIEVCLICHRANVYLITKLWSIIKFLIDRTILSFDWECWHFYENWSLFYLNLKCWKINDGNLYINYIMCENKVAWLWSLLLENSPGFNFWDYNFIPQLGKV